MSARRSLRKQESKGALVSITSVARRRLVKPHRNFEQFTAPLLELYAAHISKMRIEGLDPKATLATLKMYQALAAEEAAAEAQLARVKDTRLQLGSQVWSTELKIYANAKFYARTDPAIKEAIADFEQFMKRAPKKKKSGGSSGTPSSGSSAA
jgi:hypothetical protein